MALNWNLYAIKNKEDVCYPGNGDHLNPLTEGLIWATPLVGFGKITEENAEEFYHRLQFVTWTLKVETDITLTTIREHIGLKTNVTDMSWNQFIKMVADSYCRNNNFKPAKKPRKKQRN